MGVVHVILQPFLPVVLEVTVETSEHLPVVDTQDVPLQVGVVSELERAFGALVQVLLLLEIVVGQVFAEALSIIIIIIIIMIIIIPVCPRWGAVCHTCYTLDSAR